ncbi:MAG: ATP synthase F1 subunit epsilon [Halobacteriovoraceae bacterium]|nr:ATP synthase F1 subunit epsilon [Halobacteriovoraceae bacterium]|tara:strand:+ start:10558 stop:10971 length:414 start_codon:yes stop_codon:yes gene_type:complete
MNNYNVDIFTPNGVVVHNLAADELFVPTKAGEINVLKDHTHLITELSSGMLTAKSSSGDRHFAVHAGLCKILGNKVTILSSTSEKAEEIDVERAKAAKAKAESRLKDVDSLTDVDYIKFRNKLDRANVRLKLAELNK